MSDLTLNGMVIGKPFQNKKRDCYLLRIACETPTGAKLYTVYSKTITPFEPITPDGKISISVDVQDFVFASDGQDVDKAVNV